MEPPQWCASKKACFHQIMDYWVTKACPHERWSTPSGQPLPRCLCAKKGEQMHYIFLVTLQRQDTCKDHYEIKVLCETRMKKVVKPGNRGGPTTALT